MLTLSRNLRIDISSNGRVTQTEVPDEDRLRLLVEEIGISEEAANALPPDEPEGASA